MLASLVGDDGEVVGIDRDAGVLEVARVSADELGLRNISFVTGDFCAPSPELGDFDAVVGRRVLMYQPDPVGAVRGLVRVVRPGGFVVFQELDTTMVPASLAPLPLHRRVHDWIWRTVEGEGADVHMGFRLESVLIGAGLREVEVRAEAIVQTPCTPSTAGAIVRAMTPRIVRQGVATEAELDVDTLDGRLMKERRDANATYVGDMVFGAWARRP
jgi:SAM-dependent methyltransferase